MKFDPQSTYIIAIAVVIQFWTVFWKGVALWRSAKNSEKTWFIVLLIITPINLLGIPELIYLFGFSKKKLTIEEVKSWFQKKKK